MYTLYEQYLQSIGTIIDVRGIDVLKEVVDPFHVGDVDNHSVEYYTNEYWCFYEDCIYEWFTGLLGEFDTQDEFETLFEDYYNHHKDDNFNTKEELFRNLMIEAINDNLW